MHKRFILILIIASVLMLLHSVCFAGARSVQTTKSRTTAATLPSNKTAPAAVTSPKVAAPLGKANLVVSGGVSYAPVKDGMITPGANMRLGFYIKNKGNKASEGLGTYSIKCTVLSGGKCPVVNVNNKPVPNLAPGASKSFTLIQAKAAEKGKYLVTITTKPTSARGRPKQIQFTVGTLVVKSPRTQGLSTTTQTTQPEPPQDKKSTKFLSPGAIKGFNPQPEPPRVKGAQVTTDLGAQGAVPQQETPQEQKGTEFSPGAIKGFNPQPEPPKFIKGAQVTSDLGAKGMHPQPEMPGAMPMSSQSTVMVTLAKPAAVDLLVGSARSMMVTLEGTNLNKINTVQLVPGSGLSVKFIGSSQPGKRLIMLQASKGALVGKKSLRIVASGVPMDVPLSTFTARVVGPTATGGLELKTPKQSPTNNQPDPKKWSESGVVLPGVAESSTLDEAEEQLEEDLQLRPSDVGIGQGMHPDQPPNPGDPAPEQEDAQGGQVLPGQSQGMNPVQPPNPGDPAPLMSKGADGKKN